MYIADYQYFLFYLNKNTILSFFPAALEITAA